MGKGDKRRKEDRVKIRNNWDAIFKPKVKNETPFTELYEQAKEKERQEEK
jgi:hypothetical protein